MIWLLLASWVALADEPAEEESDDEGWGEESDDEGWGEGSDDVGFGEAESEDDEEVWTDWFTVGGTYRSDNAMWLDRLEDEPVASVRHWLDLSVRFKRDIWLAEASVHGEIDLAYLMQQDRYDDATMETYAYQFAPRTLFVEAAPGDLYEISLGRQVVAWGEGLILSPLDVVSPKDLRDPGVADLEELRLPIGMLRFSMYPEDQRLDLMFVPEAFYGYRPTPAGPFGLVDDLVGDTELAAALEGKTLRFSHVQGGLDPEAFEGFLRWRYRGSGFDVAFYGGSLLDDTGILILPTQEDLADDELTIEIDHRRYTLVGHSGNALVTPSVLVRWEAGLDIGREFAVGELEGAQPQVDVTTSTLAQWMAGVEYSGLPRTTLLLELRMAAFAGSGLWARGEPLPNIRPTNLVFPVDSEVIALRGTHHLLRERLEFSALAMLFGADLRHGAQVWAGASYEFADGVQVGTQVILPFPTDTHGPMFGLDEHHRMFLRLRMDF